MPFAPRLVQGDFNQRAFTVIRNFEQTLGSFDNRIHDDGIHIPTLGWGYALIGRSGESGNYVYSVSGTLAADFQAAGITLLTDDQKTHLNAARKALDDKVSATAITELNWLRTNVPSITQLQADALFNVVLGRKLGEIRSQLKKHLLNTDGQALFDQLANTEELVTIASLAYNLPTLVGPQLALAMKNGDRAAAWFEIRYGSNGGKDESTKKGLQKRRYYESELFGLYRNPATPTAEEARQVFTLLDRKYPLGGTYRSKIMEAEKLYGLLPIANDQTQRGSQRDINLRTPLEAASQDYNLSLLPQGRINNLVQSLDIGLDLMLQQVNDGNPGASVSRVSLSSALALFVASDPDASANLNARYVLNGTTEIEIRNVLVGSNKADTLTGGKGDDVLIGGAGGDTYYYRSGDGNDRIIDDGEGDKIILQNAAGATVSEFKAVGGFFFKDNNVPSNVWRDATGSITVTHNSPYKIVLDDGSTIQLGEQESDFQSGDFGLHLKDMPTAPTAPQTSRDLNGGETLDGDAAAAGVQITYDDLGNIIAAPGTVNANIANILTGSTGSDHFLAGGGNDTINAAQSSGANATGDWIEAGTGNDTVTAGSGGDKIDLGEGNDIAQGGEGANWVLGGAGRDTVTTGSGKDWIEGGIEGDVLFSGAGDDAVYADSSNGNSVTLQQAVADGDNFTGSSTQGDLISLGDGDDIAYGSIASDLIFGGAGEDLVIAGAGDDTIFTDFDATSGEINWTVTRSRSVSNGVATVNITSGQVEAAAVAGAADAVYAGQGDDWVFTGAGDDYVDAGAGDDVVFGEGGNDVILLGAGDDIAYGDSLVSALSGPEGDDFIDGGDGNDVLVGNGGDDILIGGAGDDVLWGAAGNDTLTGGPGNDMLRGGTGRDTYVFNRGDGVETIIDPDDAQASSDGTILPANADASVIVLGEGIAREDVKFHKGSMLLDLGQGDAIHFNVANPADPTFTPLIGELQFADGSVMTFDDVLAQGFDIDGTEGNDAGVNDGVNPVHPVLTGTGVTDRINGLGGDDILRGLGGDDALMGGAGSDWLDGGLGADTLTGGTSSDYLDGGLGQDTYVFNLGDGQDLIKDRIFETGGADASVIRFGAGIAAAGLVLRDVTGADGTPLLEVEYGAGDRVTIDNGPNGAEGAVLRYEFAGGAALTGAELFALAGQNALTLSGTAAADTLTGGFGADTLDGGDGNDTLSGGRGNDTLLGGNGAASGNDWLNGGAGSDTLIGGTGIDTYALTLDAGVDTVIEAAGETSILSLPEGYAANLLAGWRDGNDLRLSLDGENSGLRLKDYYTTGGQTWQVKDQNGQTTDLALLLPALVSPGDAQLINRQYGAWLAKARANEGGFGLAGPVVNTSDASYIRRASDTNLFNTYTVWGNGSWEPITYTSSRVQLETVNAGNASNTVDFWGAGAVFGGGGNDLIYHNGSTGLNYDYTAFDREYGRLGTGLFIDGGAGDDLVVGSWDNDTLIVGDGSDTLIGQEGHDTYYVLPGKSGATIVDEVRPYIAGLPQGLGFRNYQTGDRYSVDTVEFGPGITLNDLLLTQGTVEGLSDYGPMGRNVYQTLSFDTLDISWGGAGQSAGSVRVVQPSSYTPYAVTTGGIGVEYYKFADGTRITAQQLTERGFDLRGTAGADTLTGSIYSDHITGGGGNDALAACRTMNIKVDFWSTKSAAER